MKVGDLVRYTYNRNEVVGIVLENILVDHVPGTPMHSIQILNEQGNVVVHNVYGDEDYEVIG